MVTCYAGGSGQKELAQAMKPAHAKSKPKAKAKAKAKHKAQAKPKANAHGPAAAPAATAAASSAPPAAEETSPNPDDELTFSLRRHKRKSSTGDEIKIFAINCVQTGKQIGQLSQALVSDAENLVADMVKRLNEGSLSVNQAQAELAALKEFS